MSPPWGYGPNPSGARLPSFGRRLGIAIVLIAVLLALTVGVPTYLLGLVTAHGGNTPVSGFQLTAGGLAISALAAAAYVLRPTRAYGPLVAARGVVTMVYLLSIAELATVSFALDAGVGAAVSFGALLRWFALVPLFSVAGGLFITGSDLRDLYARLRVEFPA